MQNNLLRKSALWFLLLCSVNFFELGFIGEAIVSKAEVAGIALLLAIIIFSAFTPLASTTERNFSFIPTIVVLAILASCVGAQIIHEQPFFYSLLASRILFYYLFYHFLHIIKPSREELLKAIFLMAFIYVIIYSIQYLIYPRQILLTRMAEDRAKVRIRLPGYSYVLFAILFSTYFFVVIKKKLTVIMVGIFGSVFIIFLGTRIVMVSTYLSQMVMFMTHSSKSVFQFLVIAIILMSAVPIVVDRIDPTLIDNLVRHTQNDQKKKDDYIRIIAFEYYLDKMKLNPISFITGHGNPTGGEKFTSDYSEETNIEKKAGLFLDDLGQFGSYYRYGIMYLLFIILLYIQVWKVSKKQNANNGFIKYWFGLILLISITIPVFITHPDVILIICICMYLADLGNENTQNISQ